ncbi:MAG: leucine-rich repeat protein [Alistipes sp.]|nr:leucine-rich repeat protein [Alistipes sp.]
MKLRYLFNIGMAAMLLAGCTQEPDGMEIIAPTTPEIRIDGSIDQQYISRVDDGGFCDGDQIGLYGVNYTEDNTLAGELKDNGNQVNNARYTFDEENWRWVSAGSVYYKDAVTNIDLYGYYPYGKPESVSAYQFEVKQDQSGKNVENGYAMSDFLWGKATGIAPTEQKIMLYFNHIMACANVILKEGDGFAEGEFAALDKAVLVANTTRSAHIDLSTGEVTATGDAEAEGIVMKQGADGFRAVVVPQSMEAGEVLFRITVDGINYHFKRDNAFAFESGMQYKFTIKVSKKAVTGSYSFELEQSEIIDWVADIESHGGEARQYFVVHQDEPGTLGAKIRATKKNPNKIKNLKISGKIDDRDFRFMKDSMEILQAINLKESEIVGSWRYHVKICENGVWGNYHDEIFLGEMPESDEECHKAVMERYPNADYFNWSSRNQINYAHEIPSSAFSGKISLAFFAFPEKVTKIGGSAFSGTLLSGALIIPNDVVEIGSSAFSGTYITSLKLPLGLKILGGSVFSGCTSLAGELSLPESLESIGGSCFNDCAMLSGELVLPSKLTSIPDNCFNNCKGFTGNLIIHEGITSIGYQAFHNMIGVKGTLSLPNSLKTLSYGSFYNTPLQGELVIPAQIQKLPQVCFCGTDFSSVTFAENSELLVIEGGTGDGSGWNGAFSNCQRICEPIVLPNGLITIEGRAFYNCHNLPSIVIPESVSVLGIEAFENCYNLSAITCHAKMPPICGTGAFKGVAKDNFTLEVPEQSVVKYQTANGWSDFRRIAAHYDFSLSRPLLRTLNAEHSATYVMRAPAGYAWSIESAPEWVTVTPSSGVGKVDVTITVDEMAAGEAGEFETLKDGATFASPSYTKHAGRKGEIVFKLDAKDYRTTMTVEQFDYEYGDGDVIVNQTATVGDGVNIVFMGDCFDAKDIADGSYLAGIEEAIGYYFAIEPYKSYKDYFNVYTVVGMSPDTGMGTVNTIKEAKFGSMYSLEGIAPDTKTTYEYAMKIDGIDEEDLSTTLVVMVENTEDYGGICYMWGDGSAIAICPMSRDAYPYDFRGIVQHEAGGHGFAKLGDEYIYHNAFIQTCTCICCDHLDEFNAAKALGWYRNLSTNADMKTVEWAHFIYHPDYSNIVDMYEGGYFHTRGMYRSEATSCMNNNIPYYSAISRQEMVERIMRYAGEEFSLEAFYANDVRDASNNTTTTRSGEMNAVELAGASKQLPPKYMGDKPQLK